MSKRGKVKIPGILLLFFMLLFVYPSAAHAENVTIQCGDNVYGTLDELGVLTISGSGDMWNCVSGESYFDWISEDIYKVIIQDGVTSIGDYAFYRYSGYNNMQSVSIGKGVRSIGEYAFARTYGLFSIDIPANVQTIGEGAFYNSAIKTCTLHEGLRNIELYAFQYTLLSAIIIPDGVTAVRAGAFAHCGYLRNVTIPANIGVIESGAFGEVSATIYSKTVTIVNGAFDRYSTFTARKGSSADVYAANYGLDIHYFACLPSSGLPSLDHNFDAGKVTTAATCKSKGVKTYTCTICGKKKTETLDKTGHRWNIVPTVEKKATCDEDGIESIRCSVCNKVKSTQRISAKGHKYGKWKTTVKPTVLKKGTETRRCSVCGKKQTSSISKLKPSIKLSVSKLTIKVGQSSTKIKVASMGSGDSVASWQSTDKSIVTVNSKGKITGKKAGTARIKVTLKSGISKTVKVTVKRIAAASLKVTAEKVTVKNGKMTLKKGKKYSLTVKVSPSDSTDKVKYSSSEKSVVTVNSKGKVTAKKAGTAKITVKAGSKKKVINVTVR